MTEIKTREDVLHNLGECVRWKSLWNKAEMLQHKIDQAFESQSAELMLSGEDKETRMEIDRAISHLEKFKQNLSLKPKYQKILGEEHDYM